MTVDETLRWALEYLRAGRESEARRIYENVLRSAPDHPDALHYLGLILASEGKFPEAVVLLRRAVVALPEVSQIGITLAGVLRDSGDIGGAIAELERLIRLDENNAQAWLGKGNAHYRQDQLSLAIESFQRALAIDPGLIAADRNMGATLMRLGRYIEAIACFERVLKIYPEDATLIHNVGKALRGIRKYRDAIERHQTALRLRPEEADGWLHLSLAEIDARRYAEALVSSARAIALQPKNLNAIVCAGIAYRQLGDFPAAAAAFDRVISVAPNHQGALSNLAILRLDEQKPEDALLLCDTVLALHPDDAYVWNTRSSALERMLRHEEAIVSTDRAIALRPEMAEAWNNRGCALYYLGRHEEAVGSYDAALASWTDFPDAKLNKAIAYLKLGDFARGWLGFEARWDCRNFREKRPDFAVPQWVGQPIAGKRILLHAEQGLGDTIQFCRYASMVAALGAEVILAVPDPLVRLMRTLPGVGTVVSKYDGVSSIDFHCPLMSLPLAFGTNLATIPGETPYLAAESGSVVQWRDRLGTIQDLKVGLVWGGNPRPEEPVSAYTDRRRSVALAALMPVLNVSDVWFASLQIGPPAAQLHDLRDQASIIDWTAELTDFADTAALIKALDLIISVDTSVAHLAGALGVPVWVFNRFDGCWRWLSGRTTTPWYSTMRLFNQHHPLNWDPTIRSVGEALNIEARAKVGSR